MRLAVLLVACPSPGTGQADAAVLPWPPPTIQPRGISDTSELLPGEELRVFLMVFGPGADLLERFGHSALWIQDTAAGTDRAYNYGLSNIREPGFLRSLVQGRILSSPAVRDPQQMLSAYPERGRSARILELNLSPSQRLALRDLLDLDVQAGGRMVRHDFFQENCTTPLRDALDLVIGGQLRAQTEGLHSDATFRSHVLEHVADSPLLHAGLAVGMGGRVDRPLTAWEEMFLPSALGDRLLDVVVRDEQGAGVPLVLSVDTMALSDGFVPAQATSWLWYLMLGLGLGGAMASLGVASTESVAARVGFALLSTSWLVMVGTVGFVLGWLWLVAGQPIAQGNENLLVVQPVALLLIDRLWSGALGDGRALLHARWLAFLMVACAVAAVVIKIIPGTQQANGVILMLTVPSSLGLAWGVWRFTEPAPEIAHRDASLSTRGLGEGAVSLTTTRIEG